MQKEEKMSDLEKSNGVMGLFISPEGRVVCAVSDFKLDKHGGFKLHESQRIRVKDIIIMEVIATYCGAAIINTITKYNAERVVEDMKGNGYSLVFKLIGHPDIEPHENDYLDV